MDIDNFAYRDHYNPNNREDILEFDMIEIR
jgi:hypothetical protein